MGELGYRAGGAEGKKRSNEEDLDGAHPLRVAMGEGIDSLVQAAGQKADEGRAGEDRREPDPEGMVVPACGEHAADGATDTAGQTAAWAGKPGGGFHPADRDAQSVGRVDKSD